MTRAGGRGVGHRAEVPGSKVGARRRAAPIVVVLTLLLAATSVPAAWAVTMTTFASPNVSLGGLINDTAVLDAGTNPTGSISFALFGPDDAACAGQSIFDSTVPVTGNGTYVSHSFTPALPGTYRWVATYSGDAGNPPASGACNDPNESVVVGNGTPPVSLSTVATVGPPTVVGDVATLTGGANPTGTITFVLFGPNDALCSGPPAFTTTVPVNGPGDYSSGPFATAAPGTYRWVASYSGDAGNAGVSGACNDPNESVVVAAPPVTISTQTGATAVVGEQVTDTASLSGGFALTGSIGFRLFGPDDADCLGAPVFTSTVPVAGPGSYTSDAFAPAVPGTYRWIAAYSGDSLNGAATGACNDTDESVLVSMPPPIIPSLSTEASPAVAVGGTIFDTAALSGGLDPAGSITFDLYGPDDAECTGPPVFSSTVTVAGNGQYTSETFSPSAPGIYRWVARYSGDGRHSPVFGLCNGFGESVEVGLAPVVLSTQASPSVTVGAQLSDTATLSGGADPTGSITFTLYGPDDATCSAPPVFTSTVAVSGTGSYTSGSFTPLVPGVYRWVAAYSGDVANAAVSGACNDPDESAVVTVASPVTLSTSIVAVGPPTSIGDVATLGGGFNPTGTITFSLYGPDDATCSGPVIFTSTQLVGGAGNYTSALYTPAASGTYRWIAAYSGDALNGPVSGACNDPGESVFVAVVPPLTISTQATPSVVIGSPIVDTATLAGGTDPVGTLTFSLFGPDDVACAGPPVFVSSVAVSGAGDYTSGSFTPSAPGTYRWIAAYGGDAVHPPVAGSCNDPDELSVVNDAPPLSLTTDATVSVPLGGSITDTAMLSGGNGPTGTITFVLHGPDDPACAGVPVFTSTVGVSGTGAYTSGVFTPTAPGTYRWVAAYSGDAVHPPVTGACNDPGESSVVLPPPVATLSTDAGEVAPGSMQVVDTATVTGSGPAPTGVVTFSLYGPGDAICAGPPIFVSANRPLGGGPPPTATSDPFTVPAPGTYRWIAAYSGDANYAPVTGACNDPGESVAVVAPPVTISTEATPTVQLGSAVHDTAALSGGANPTGTIAFSLFGPDDASCAGSPVFTSTVPVTLASASSGSFVPGAPGTYRWIAAYSGDANHQPVSGACNDPDESTVVRSPPPLVSLSTRATPSAQVGDTIDDTATLAGGSDPTGTITFSLYGPNDAACAGPSVFTSTVPVTGAGTYTSASFTPTAAGSYHWVAVYSGDADNPAATSPCGAPDETSNVSVVPSFVCLIVRQLASFLPFLHALLAPLGCG